MHADEDDLKTADEEAEREQHVAAMAERLAHRFAGRLFEQVGVRAQVSLDHRRGQRDHQQTHARERQ